MKEKDIPNIPCDYHGNDWHEQLFTGNTDGVGFIIELLSSSFYTLRIHVYKGLSNVSHTEDSAVENRLFTDVFFHLMQRPFNICLPLFIYTVSVGFVSQLMPLLAIVIQTLLVSLVSCYSIL